MAPRDSAKGEDAGVKPGATFKPDFRRKNIRLAAENYRGRKMYFLTLCFERRETFGADPQIAAWLIERLRKCAVEAKFFVHAYCVMPDHVHALVCAASDGSDVMRFVEKYKQVTGFAFKKRARRQLWQFKYYDR